MTMLIKILSMQHTQDSTGLLTFNHPFGKEKQEKDTTEAS